MDLLAASRITIFALGNKRLRDEGTTRDDCVLLFLECENNKCVFKAKPINGLIFSQDVLSKGCANLLPGGFARQIDFVADFICINHKCA
mgnify:CR=1 FL=1